MLEGRRETRCFDNDGSAIVKILDGFVPSDGHHIVARANLPNPKFTSAVAG
jgi:hypothetical protein